MEYCFVIVDINDSIASVGALIHAKSTGRFLFLLRNNGGYAGTWGLAGGKIERKETTSQALLREIKEEIGVDLYQAKIVPVDLFTSPNGRFVYNTYIVAVENEFLPTLNDEHRGYCWCSIGDYPKPLHPGVYGTFKIDAIQSKIETAVHLI